MNEIINRVSKHTSDKKSRNPHLVDALKEITEAEYDILCKKTNLTRAEFASVLNYALKNGVNIITLNIKQFTKENENELSRITNYTYLSHGVKWFVLDSLTDISKKAADAIRWLQFLSLWWLKTITPDIAAKFSNIRFLYLDWLTEVDADTIVKLWKKECLSMRNIKEKSELNNKILSQIKTLYIGDNLYTG